MLPSNSLPPKDIRRHLVYVLGDYNLPMTHINPILRHEPNRTIRVFVSSTFRDMRQERDQLTLITFPLIRKLCETRGVGFCEIDLRWGITEEEAAEGRVLDLCLAEIDNCRPFFIGILGQRYGWVAADAAASLAQRAPGLLPYADRSVTELEIRHALLNRPADSPDPFCFFYFRDPAYQAPAAVGEAEDYRSEDVQAATRLAMLKDEIRASDCSVRENYPDPQTLAQWLQDDLMALINRLFPADSLPDPRQREWLDRHIFAAAQARGYVDRQRYYARLDAFAADSSSPLLVTGETGCGKSALLANWVRRRQELARLHPQGGPAVPLSLGRRWWRLLTGQGAPAVPPAGELLVQQFTGAGVTGGDWREPLRQLLEELKIRLGLQQVLPNSPEDLAMAFRHWLGLAGTRRVVLILDGLDAVMEDVEERELDWLPARGELPSNVRLIVSTDTRHPLQKALLARGWQQLAVMPLSLRERRQLVQVYLGQFGKRLSPRQTVGLTEIPQSANPLYLRALLEELRQFGIYERFDQHLGDYLTAADPLGLFQRILARLERDYCSDQHPNLVSEALALLAVSRRGLTEGELLDLLGSSGRPLPGRLWSPFYLAVERFLLNRAGLLSFLHETLRQAVEQRYLQDRNRCHDHRRQLVAYFAVQGTGPRALEELPWQLACLEDWTALAMLLSDIDYLTAAWRRSEYEVRAYWTLLAGRSAFRPDTAYGEVLEAPLRHPEAAAVLMRLLTDLGYTGPALELGEYLIAAYRSADNSALSSALGNQAELLMAVARYTDALVLLQEQRQLCQVRDGRELQACVGNLALAHAALGDVRQALALHEEEEDLCRRNHDDLGLATSLGNQGRLHYTLGNKARAWELFQHQEVMARRRGDLRNLQASLHNQSRLLAEEGKFRAALALHEEEAGYCRQLGDRRNLHISLGSQAEISMKRKDFDRALELFQEKEKLARVIGDPAGVAVSLVGQARIFRDIGQPTAGALALAEEAMRLAQERDLVDLVRSIKLLIADLSARRSGHSSH